MEKINSNVIEGIIDFDEVNLGYKFGMFEKAFEGDYFIESNYGKFVVCNKDVFNKIPKIFSAQEGSFYDLKRAFLKDMKKRKIDWAQPTSIHLIDCTIQKISLIHLLRWTIPNTQKN